MDSLQASSLTYAESDTVCPTSLRRNSWRRHGTKPRNKCYQLTTMDRAPLSDAQSTIALYTQSAVVRRCRSPVNVRRGVVLLPGAINIDGRCLYRVLSDAGRVVAKFYVESLGQTFQREAPIFLPPPKKEVMFLVRSVCLSVCLSDYSQTCERILTKFFGGVGHGSRTK